MEEQSGARDLQQFASQLVEATKEYIFIRPEDGLIIMRPNRLNFLNETAVMMLQGLYGNASGPDVEGVLTQVSQHYDVGRDQVQQDLLRLLQSLSALLNDDICAAPSVKQTGFGSHSRELPVLSEIAVTYRCQNRCTFCYADAPKRGRDVPEMTTAEVCTIIDRIFDEAHCPTVSFTGGEPTLRPDLPELVAYARAKGMRVNLITNGFKCADEGFVADLAKAGLHSAQVSIEGGSSEVHDAITQHPGSFERAVAGVGHLRGATIHTHTNTTICGGNRHYLHGHGLEPQRGRYPLHRDRRDHRVGAEAGEGEGCAPGVVLTCALLPLQPGAGEPGEQIVCVRRRPHLCEPCRGADPLLEL